MLTEMMFNNMDQQAMRSFMNSKFESNNNVNINRMGANNDLFNDQYVDWTSRRQQGPVSGGVIGQQYSRQNQNEWAEEYESSGASSPSDTSVTQHNSTKPAAPSLPPRPQRPFTEYNVFFQLERELLLQDKPTASDDDLQENETAQKLLSSGKEIESPEVAALRPPQYRHLLLSTDWYVVGNKYKSNASARGSGTDDTGTENTSKRRAAAKKKEVHGKISFLELTKLISTKWKDVCQNDPVTKEFCKKIAVGEATRYKKELEDYRNKYGVEAAKGKKRKVRKSQQSSGTQEKKKTKQGKEGGIDMRHNFVPIDRGLADDVDVSPTTFHKSMPPMLNPSMASVYARQQEIKDQLMQQSNRNISNPPMNPSFMVNTFQGIPKGFSQHAQTFQSAVITPPGPTPFGFHPQERNMLQDDYDELQRLHQLKNQLYALKQKAEQSFLRQSSAFDSKYDFLNKKDSRGKFVKEEDKVGEFLRAYESKVSRQVSKTSDADDILRFGTRLDTKSYLQKFHRKCIQKRSRHSPSPVSQLDYATRNKFAMNNFMKMNSFMNDNATTQANVPQFMKLRSLRSNDWALFNEHVEFKDDDESVGIRYP